MRKASRHISSRDKPGPRRELTPLPQPPLAYESMADEREILRYEIESLQAELSALRSDVEAERFRYRDFFDQHTDAHLVTDKRGIIREANLAAAEMLGVRTLALLGKPLPIFVLIADRPQIRSAIDRLKDFDRFESEVRVTPRDRPQFYARLSGSVLDDSQGRPASIRWVLQDINDTRIAREEAADSREKLSRMSSELALAEERVRREIAVGIHDRVSQPLAMVRILLGRLQKSLGNGQAKAIAEIQDVLTQAIEESRTLTFELSPPILYELGLPAALEWMGEQIARRHRIKVSVRNMLEGPMLPVDTRVMAFQFVRELLANIIKHAHADAATVILRRHHRMLQMTVADNGAGFDPVVAQQPVQSTGFGLFSIRTRVKQIGGEFIIETVPGHGTQVNIRIPVPKEKPPISPFD